ncbi:MAG: hypothetical protein JRN67_06790 [Nitrososphaerota archaeon]|jgi:hypothetical protein|nr:hypothetical protein [Nitrososphaerota archaeon]
MNPNIEIGVATSSGKAYYQISTLLKLNGLSYADIMIASDSNAKNETLLFTSPENCEYKLIITTRKERSRFPGTNVVCLEDLGNDVGIAKERLFSVMYHPGPEDWFIIGIDPGERTGVAAFLNHREIESSVFATPQEAMARVVVLIDNAPRIRKIVKIGSGNMKLARSIAKTLESEYRGRIKISLVNESGTSVLRRRNDSLRGTRDQRAAKLIAFREGQDHRRL